MRILLVGKERRERKVRPWFVSRAWCTFPCVRVTVMQLRERGGDRKHENKTRPTVGAFTPPPPSLYLSRGEGRARIPATLLAPPFREEDAGKNLERLCMNVFNVPFLYISFRSKYRWIFGISSDNFFIAIFNWGVFWKTGGGRKERCTIGGMENNNGIMVRLKCMCTRGGGGMTQRLCNVLLMTFRGVEAV